MEDGEELNIDDKNYFFQKIVFVLVKCKITTLSNWWRINTFI